jgi:hypothetical protein
MVFVPYGLVLVQGSNANSAEGAEEEMGEVDFTKEPQDGSRSIAAGGNTGNMRQEIAC